MDTTQRENLDHLDAQVEELADIILRDHGGPTHGEGACAEAALKLGEYKSQMEEMESEIFRMKEDLVGINIAGKRMATELRNAESAGESWRDEITFLKNENQTLRELMQRHYGRGVARESVFRSLDGERDYQNQEWDDVDRPGNPNPLTIGEFVLLAQEYLDLARKEWVMERKPESKTLCHLRKVGAILVNCMEQHGAPRRREDPPDLLRVRRG